MGCQKKNVLKNINYFWRGGREVEGARLESV